MTFRKSLLTLALGLPLVAQAQPIQGLYIGGRLAVIS
jgi:hypothetical protein